MAISFIQYTGGGSSSGSSDLGTYTNGVIVVEVQANSAISSVSVNGIAGVQQVHNTSGQAVPILDLWTVAVGTMSGTVSWSATGGTGVSLNFCGYDGVDQTTPVNTSTQANCAGCNTISTTVTPSIAGCWAVALNRKNGACASGSPVNITNRSLPGNDNAIGFGDSNGTITSGVGYTQTISSGCTQQFEQNAIAIAPFVAAGPTNVKTFDGVTQSTGIKTYFGVALASTKTVDGIS